MVKLDVSLFKRFGKTFDKDEIVFSEYEPGNSFYLIQTGRIRLLKILNGIEKTLEILNPGEMFGEMAILEEAPRSATAVAMDHTEVFVFNRQNFSILMQGNPGIAFTLLRVFTKRIFDSKRRFQILTLKDLDARIADVFLMLAENRPNQFSDNKKKRVDFKNTVDDIAHWAGISVIETKQIISKFISQRRIEMEKDRMIVKNLGDFERLVTSRRNQQR